MSYLKISFLVLIASSTLVCNLKAAVTPQIDYTRGTTGTTVWFTTSTDASAAGQAFLFYGTFSNISSITPTTTAQEIEDDFNELGLSPAGSLDVYAIGGTFRSSVNEADFVGKRGYLIAANNSDIGLSTEIAIVSNSTLGSWTFDDTILLPESIKSHDYSSEADADIVLGSYGAGGSDFETLKMHVLTVPEPSSFALLGLGATAFLFRRKK